MEKGRREVMREMRANQQRSMTTTPTGTLSQNDLPAIDQHSSSMFPKMSAASTATMNREASGFYDQEES